MASPAEYKPCWPVSRKSRFLQGPESCCVWTLKIEISIVLQIDLTVSKTKWTGLLASRHLKSQQGFWETGPWSNCSGKWVLSTQWHPTPTPYGSQLTHVFGEEVSRVINLAWINGKHISKSSSSVNTETARGTQNWAKHIVGNLQMMKWR